MQISIGQNQMPVVQQYRGLRPFVLTFCGLLFFVGCASTPDVKVEQLERELSEIRRRQVSLAQDMKDTDRYAQMIFLLQDNLEEVGLELKAVDKRLAKMESRLKTLEMATFEIQPATAVPPVPSRNDLAPELSPNPVEPEADAALIEIDARSMYQQGYALKASNPDAASAVFLDMLTLFPDDELADNAVYWLGEIAYGQNDDQEAFQYFKMLREKYPMSNKFPDATFYLGKVAERQGDLKSAKMWYRMVVEAFPWSPLAEEASGYVSEPEE